MKLIKQICKTLDERKINGSDLLEAHFDMVLDLLWSHCLAYGKRASSLEEKDLREIFRETSEYLVKRFQKYDIDIREIHIENSEPVIEKFVTAFIFMFQRRTVNRLNRRNREIELIDELLEDFEKQGIEDLDLEEIPGLQKRLLTKENLSKTEKLFLEFIFSRMNHFTGFQAGKEEGKVNETGVSRIRGRLKKKLEKNRQELEQILLNA